jgi:hypothetical protein
LNECSGLSRSPTPTNDASDGSLMEKENRHDRNHVTGGKDKNQKNKYEESRTVKDSHKYTCKFIFINSIFTIFVMLFIAMFFTTFMVTSVRPFITITITTFMTPFTNFISVVET